MKDERKIKGLKSQLSNLIGDIEALKNEISNKQKELSLKVKTSNILKAQIKNIDTNGEIKISEHAIVRYFERVKGFNIEEIQKEILSNEVISMIETLGGNGQYPNNNFKLVMKDFTVTTII